MPVSGRVLVAVVPLVLRSAHLTFRHGLETGLSPRPPAQGRLLGRGQLGGVTPSLPGSPAAGGLSQVGGSSLRVSALSGRGLRSVGIARARLCQRPEHCRVCGDPSRGGGRAWPGAVGTPVVCGRFGLQGVALARGGHARDWRRRRRVSARRVCGCGRPGSAAGSGLWSRAYFKPGGPSSPPPRSAVAPTAWLARLWVQHPLVRPLHDFIAHRWAADVHSQLAPRGSVPRA